jgi:hypothetical protein
MRAKPPTPKRGVRVALVAGSLAVGLALGAASLGWTTAWAHRTRHDDGAPIVKIAPILTSVSVAQ